LAWTCGTGTVSKAALRLRIAQPALSRQISDLEQELGFKLFDRVGRRLLLTGEGEQLLSDCRGLLNYAAGVGERAQQRSSSAAMRNVFPTWK
jgi:LysR family nitrogen assimilation transcriptional regulator